VKFKSKTCNNFALNYTIKS